MIEVTNFIKLYEKSFIENWDLPALTEFGKRGTLDYSGLATEVAMIHMLFESIGIRPGDKIALCGKDSSDWVKTYIATVTYGAVIVPILSDFNPLDITHIVNHCGAKLLFVANPIWEHMEPDSLIHVMGVMSLEGRSVLYEGAGVEMHRHLRLLKRRFNRRYPDGYTSLDVKYADRDNSEIAEINYTSGTTGFSKGVIDRKSVV